MKLGQSTNPWAIQKKTTALIKEEYLNENLNVGNLIPSVEF